MIKNIDFFVRMLEVGFLSEIMEIVQNCPVQRQTMLFSATMTDDVDTLIKLSLKNPVRLFVDKTDDVAANLTQEFVRVRKSQEAKREGMLLGNDALIFTYTTIKCLHYHC